MKRTLVLVGLVLFAVTTWAETTSIRERLQAAADATGTNYFACRAKIVEAGSNAVPELNRIVRTTNESWQVRLMAAICLERIQRGPELKALLEHDWRTDPAYDKKWERFRQGPGQEVALLMTQRCKDQQLLFYCIETIWRDTFERLKGIKIHKMEWSAAVRQALQGSPEFEFLIPVLAERVKQDPGFKAYETVNEFSLLMGHARRTELPLILDMLPQLPMPDRRLEVDMVVGLVQRIATSEDVPQIEAFYRRRNQEVPEKVLAVLKTLRPEQPLKQ